MNIKEYEAAARHRQQIISFNAAQQFARIKKPRIPVPPKPIRPTVLQLTDAAGDYAGTYNASVEDAIAAAEEQGCIGPFTATLVPALF